MFEYKIENEEVIITNINYKCVDNIIIPETIEGYPVTTIDSYAFVSSDTTTKNIKTITIPESIININCQNGFDCLISINTNIINRYTRECINNLYVDHNPILINNKFIFAGNRIHKIKYQIANDYYAVRCIYNTEYPYAYHLNNFYSIE